MPLQPKLARNSDTQTLCSTPKRCNSNDAISTFEIHVGELHATFLRNHNMRRHKDPSRRQPKQKTTQAQQTEDPQAEDTPSPEDNPSGRQFKHRRPPQPRQPPQPPQARGHCTRYVAVHPLCGGAPEQKRCIAYGSGAAPQQTRTNAELAHRTTHRRTPPCAAGPYWRQDGHAAHAITCTPAHSGPLRHLLHPYMRRAHLGCSLHNLARNSIETASTFEIRTLKFSAFWGLANLWWRGITCEIVG